MIIEYWMLLFRGKTLLFFFHGTLTVNWSKTNKAWVQDIFIHLACSYSSNQLGTNDLINFTFLRKYVIIVIIIEFSTTSKFYNSPEVITFFSEIYVKSVLESCWYLLKISMALLHYIWICDLISKISSLALK